MHKKSSTRLYTLQNQVISSSNYHQQFSGSQQQSSYSAPRSSTQAALQLGRRCDMLIGIMQSSIYDINHIRMSQIAACIISVWQNTLYQQHTLYQSSLYQFGTRAKLGFTYKECSVTALRTNGGRYSSSSRSSYMVVAANYCYGFTY